ncbi:unnamed protein product, partial [marine sediment metagenome]
GFLFLSQAVESGFLFFNYRIIRKHAKPRRRGRSGQSSLDLLIGTGNGFKVISGDRITQTQQKIIGILHMDYDTFTNSALLRQGHADEFTIKRPVERKEVLADILGLSFYDELEGQARELAKLQETEKAQLETTIQDISDELDQKKIELESLDNEITQFETRLNQDKASAQSKASILSQQTAEAEEAVNRLNEARKGLTEIEERLARKDFAVTEQQALRELEDELARLDYDSQQHEQVRQRLINLEQYEDP